MYFSHNITALFSIRLTVVEEKIHTHTHRRQLTDPASLHTHSDYSIAWMENEDDFALFIYFFFEDPYHSCVKKYEKRWCQSKSNVTQILKSACST